MAANFLGLFFFIVGTTGISYPFRPHNPFDVVKSFRGRSEALCRLKYGPFACRNIVYHPPYFRIYTNRNGKNYPEWQNPYFRNGFEQGWPFEDRSYDFYDPYESSKESINEHDDTIEEHVNNEQKHSDYTGASFSSSSGNPTQSYAYSKSSIPSTSSDSVSFATDLYETHRKLSNSEFLPEASKDSQVSDTTSNPEISRIVYRTTVKRQQKSSSFMKKENEVENILTTSENSHEEGTMQSFFNNKDTENTSKFLINTFAKTEGRDSSFSGEREKGIQGLTFPKSDKITPTITPEIKRKSGYEFFLKSSSSQENINKPKEENLLTESTLVQEFSSGITKGFKPQEDKLISSGGIETTNHNDYEMLQNFGSSSTVFHDLSSVTIREVTPLENKINSSDDDIQPTSQTESKLESTPFRNLFSISIDKETSLKTEPVSSEEVYSRSTQNLQTESDTSLSSFTMTYDGTAAQSKLSSSFETPSTTAENFEVESTKEDSMTSNEVTSIPFKDKETEDSRKETFSTESPSLKISFAPEAITQDHVIRISTIRTVRIVVTSVFLVVALTALTILAVYVFRLRRREVEYDQLMLIR